MQRRSFALLLFCCAILSLAACDSTEDTPVRAVSFEVSGDASRAFIVQRIGDQFNSTPENLPWQTQFPANQGLELGLTATSQNEGQSVRVAIVVDGEEIAAQLSPDGTEVGVNIVVP